MRDSYYSTVTLYLSLDMLNRARITQTRRDPTDWAGFGHVRSHQLTRCFQGLLVKLQCKNKEVLSDI